jgi:uncharacterized protein (DUF952 family)
VIFHITERGAWESARAVGRYEGDSLRSEGFIHCSTWEQVPEVAERLFHGRAGLVVLTIDPTRVGAPVRYENLEGGTEQYPHVYGPLPMEAVVSVEPLVPGPDGTFAPLTGAKAGDPV